jgi:hypothetical protein
MSCVDLYTGDADLYTCGQGSGPCSLPCVRATTTREVSAVIAVPYIIVNIYNYFRLVVAVTNNLTGLILFRVGYRDLGICFSNKPGP